MCGIFGYIGNNPPSKNVFTNALNLMSHRGPDFGKTKFYSSKDIKVYFGHRRLSIIDVTNNSNQPFEYKNLSLIFNGEIYNYIELRNILKKKGYKFSTSGDTEVLIKSIHYWGEKAFKYLDGMWSIAVLNKKNNEIIFSRDRFGEKPFFFTNLNNEFYFSSEVNSIISIIPEANEVNHNNILRFCINGYKSLKKKNETFYKNIQELKPGHYIKIKDNSLKLKSYWKPVIKTSNRLSYKEIVNKAKDLIIDSVKLKMRSDVKLAFTLSGGVDSNSIVSVASKILNKEVHTFSIINKDPKYSELQNIKKVLKNFKVKHEFIKVKNVNFIEDMTQIISKRKMPILTISHYLYGQMMKSISSKGFKVVVGGYGADEMFTGYYDHFNLNLYNLKKSNNKKFNKELSYWEKYIKPNIRNPYLRKKDLYIKNKNFREHIYLNNNFFKSFLKNDWEENFYEEEYTTDLMRNRMLNEVFNEIIPVALFEEDLQSMNNSIENRNPFLDKKIFEFMQRVPSNYLINKGYSKSILRDAMSGIVDNNVLLDRKKIGFNAPLDDIFDLNLKKNRDYILDESNIYQYFDRKKIEKFLKNKKEKMPNSFSKFMFNFISCKIFLDNNR